MRRTAITMALGMLVMAAMVFGLVYFECPSGSCEHACSVSVTEGECQQQSTCCGYCTKDGGHTKDYCCLACGNPIQI
jgi:hypothetical protein